VRAVAGARTDVSVLAVDTMLAGVVPEAERAAALSGCTGRLLRVRRGSWQPTGGLLGFLIVDGMISREASLGAHHVIELLGPGDVVHSPVQGASEHVAPVEVTAVLESLVIVLGPTFIAAAARWPAVLVELQARSAEQHDRLMTQCLIAQLPRADHRIMAALWHIADRWGRVTPDGVIMPLRLTHAMLGKIVAASRPTVTLAINELDRDGKLRRMPDGAWLLDPDSRPPELDRTAAVPVSRRIAVRARSAELHDQSAALIAQAQRLIANSPAGRIQSDAR
jgi:CRP/FNR family transcriptional regulator, cyclic AMP receptor protein